MDIVGKKFGRLYVTNNFERRKNKYSSRIYWLCKCDCGNETFSHSSELIRGHKKSCGCLQKDVVKQRQTKSGLGNTRIYKIWIGMKQRCNNPNNSAWEHYGGRGIKVCVEWLGEHEGFLAFYKWSINNGYSDELTIEIINVDGNYSPDNCKWETWGAQRLNRKNTVKIPYLGKDTPLKTVCEILGVNYFTALSRYKKGYSVDEILSLEKIKRISCRKE